MDFPSSETGGEFQEHGGQPETTPDEETHATGERGREGDVEGAEGAIGHLRSVYEHDRDEFFRMAAVRDLPPDVRQALVGILTLSADALSVLRDILMLPEPYRRALVAALDLPDEARHALRGLLASS